ncbi:MAG: single-stranded DNA-binding protein [Bacteroidales bacterium]|nr:single-stranded DNA-binding protein [Bacteroidales bacterium]
MSTNVCTFCGRLGNNPEITILPSGKERVRFSVAVDRNYKREDGSRPTDWISVVIWGSSAYVKKTNLHKGDKVVVSGRYEINEWTDKDGIIRSMGALNCTNIELVEHKKSDKDKAVEDALANQNNPMNEDDDLPF